MSSGQRKRRGGPHNSRLPQKRIRLMASTSASTSETEPIELGESAPEELEDLAGQSSSPAAIDVALDDSDETDAEDPEEVVDTSSESSVSDILAPFQDDSDESDDEESDESHRPREMVVIFIVHVERPVEENQQEGGNSGPRIQQQLDITVPATDDPDEPRHNDMPPGTIRCPVCMDFYLAIVQSRRHLVATICGHVFCNRCLCNSLMNANFCPTCRTVLGDADYHRLYI